jgi:hypothetical protein
MPTDRPSTLKGYVYYQLGWLRKFTTDFGILQTAYSGTPLTSELDVGYSFQGQPAFPTDIVGRGKWIDVKQDPSTGLITTSAPYVKRTAMFWDSDFNLKQEAKLGESKTIAFDMTFTNALNQHSKVAYWENIDSDYSASNYVAPGGQAIFNGLNFYSAAMSPYNYTQLMNNDATGTLNGTGSGPITIDSMYGKPYEYQTPRNIRLGLHITF